MRALTLIKLSTCLVAVAVPAIAGYLHNVLVNGIPAVIAAKIRIRSGRATAHFMPAFSAFCHIQYLPCPVKNMLLPTHQL